MKGINIFLNPPFFVSMATAAKFVQPILIFLAYLIPLAVLFYVSFSLLLLLLLLLFFHTFFSARFLGDALIKLYETFTKFHEVCFQGNCGKVCPTDSDFLAYLVPLDLDVVPIKIHQFLFGE
jgi:hypothetical protein